MGRHAGRLGLRLPPLNLTPSFAIRGLRVLTGPARFGLIHAGLGPASLTSLPYRKSGA